MTDAQLTALSTICWVVATVSVFILLAEWSAGTSWGISAGIVNGVRGWTRGHGLLGGRSSSTGELPPLVLPSERPDREPQRPISDPAPMPIAEIDDLASRRI